MAGKRFAIFSLFGLLALALAVLGTSGADAQTYNPTLGYTLDNTGGGAASDSHNIITINAPDLNYEDSSMFSLVPLGIESEIVPVLGAGMGALSASSTVGLLGGPCNTVLPPIFDMYNATVDTSNELSPADMYWVLKDKDAEPIPYGAGNAELPDYLEGYPHFLNEMLDPDGAGPLTPLRPIARYAGHDFVASMNILVQIVEFSPGDLATLPGIYAQMGAAVGNPSLIVLDNPVSADSAPGAISDFCTALWTDTTLYATTTDNPDTTGVDESGISAQQNPLSNTGVLDSGTHVARNYSRSERDADGDGHENDLDPCRYSADPTWDPRANCTGIPPTKPGDVDCDGLPSSCDPSDATKNTDQDGDGYDNGQDICPLVANGCQDSACHPTIFNPAWDNQADDDSQLANTDLGPGPDSIGNACDDSDNDGNEDGAGPGTCTDGIDNGPDGAMDQLDADCAAAMDDTDADPWGTNPGTGQFYHAMPVAAVCVGGTDLDTDGWCDGLETTLGGDGSGTPESLVIDVVINAPGGLPSADVPQSCNDGVDNDNDGKTDAADNDAKGCDPSTYGTDTDYDGHNPDNCPSVWNPEQEDTDGDGKGDACDDDTDDDGWSDVIEAYLRTDRYDDCSDWTGQHDAWPLDSNIDRSVTVVGDVLPYSGNIGAAVSSNPDLLQRRDLNADGSITVVGDVLPYSGNIGASCT